MPKTNNLKSLKKNQLIKIIRGFERAVKLKCHDCMGGQKKIDCELKDCPLYFFRPWARTKSGEDSVTLRDQEIKNFPGLYEND